MNIVFTRGHNNGIYIVEYKEKYYLVNTKIKTVSKAEPDYLPDMFLKFGYFYEVEENSVPLDEQQIILDLLKTQ